MSLTLVSVAFDSSLFRTQRFLALPVVPTFAVVVFRLLRVVVVIVVDVVVAAVVDVASLGPLVFLHFLQMKSSSGFTWLLIRPTHNM